MRKEKTLGIDRKKVTALGRSFTVLGSTFGADYISEEVAGVFTIYGFPGDKHCVHCLLCLIVVFVILSVKDPNVMLA